MNKAGYKQDVPFFSHDGKKLFFISTRPQRWYRLWSDEALWVVEKKKEGWSRPEKAGERINRIETHWQFSVSSNGNIYLNGKEGDRWFIFRSEWKDGEYSEPVKSVQPRTLAEGQSLYLFPFVAPDESYLLFSGSRNGDQGDLFVTYRKEDGSWTEETSLGDNINSPGLEICPMVSPDGKCLFYMRRDAIMWVSAEIIEEMRPKE